MMIISRKLVTDNWKRCEAYLTKVEVSDAKQRFCDCEHESGLGCTRKKSLVHSGEEDMHGRYGRLLVTYDFFMS